MEFLMKVKFVLLCVCSVVVTISGYETIRHIYKHIADKRISKRLIDSSDSFGTDQNVLSQINNQCHDIFVSTLNDQVCSVDSVKSNNMDNPVCNGVNHVSDSTKNAHTYTGTDTGGAEQKMLHHNTGEAQNHISNSYHKANPHDGVCLADYSESVANLIERVILSTVSIATMEKNEVSARHVSSMFENHYLKGIATKDFMYGLLDISKRKNSVIPGCIGSGFIVKIENGIGYIVTNYHVIDGAKKVVIFLHDKTPVSADIHGYDELVDVAVLKFKVSDTHRSMVNIPTLQWGDSSKVREGNIVFAIGNPFGLGGTVTSGIVSSVRRNIHDDLVLNNNFQRDVYLQSSHFIQHSASINVGSSGGCLINANGEVIGVNRNIVPGSNEDGGNIGIALAIPSNMARTIVDKIIRYGGSVDRGWIGVITQFISSKEFAAMYGSKIEKYVNSCGFFISNVLDNSPASKSGFKPFDIIVAINDKCIADSMDLVNFIGAAKIGECATFTLLRNTNGSWKTINIKVSIDDINNYESSDEISIKQHDDDRKRGENIRAIDISDVGVSVKDLPKFITEHDKFGNNAKVVVVHTDVANAPYSTSFEIGDGVVAADGKYIDNAYHLKTIVEQAKYSGKRYVHFIVQRGRTHYMIAKEILGINDNYPIGNNVGVNSNHYNGVAHNAPSHVTSRTHANVISDLNHE